MVDVVPKASVGHVWPSSHVALKAVVQSSPPSKPQASLARSKATVAEATQEHVLAVAQHGEVEVPSQSMSSG